MSNDKIPCEECISYAICKHLEKIRCDLLFYYVDRRNSFPIEMPNTHDIYHDGPYSFGHYLNKGTTRWFPDS